MGDIETYTLHTHFDFAYFFNVRTRERKKNPGNCFYELSEECESVRESNEYVSAAVKKELYSPQLFMYVYTERSFFVAMYLSIRRSGQQREQ